MSNKDKEIKKYEKGAANSRELQRLSEKVGNTEGARIAGESVDANLDAINELKKQK